MSTHDDKVKRLLDGEIDEAEIAAAIGHRVVADAA